MIDNNLAILDPKPHLYTLFTYKNVPPGESFIAGVAWVGTTCYGKLVELHGDNLSNIFLKKQESQRSSINLYANVLNDLEVAEVYFFHVYYVAKLFNLWSF